MTLMNQLHKTLEPQYNLHGMSNLAIIQKHTHKNENTT